MSGIRTLSLTRNTLEELRNRDFLRIKMSDPFSVGLDEDPAADFLAREQQELAGLEDDGFGGLASDSPAAGEANQVNGDVSPPESEVAPTQKTLLWREEQLKKIAEKDKNEEAKLEEWRNTAKRELEEWYARQAEQVEKHKKNNRVAEAEFVKERDETTPGNEWERISRLCDFNPKNNKNTKDVSKLRSLLLQLKQNPLARSSTA